MKKRVLCSLTLVLILILTACGNNQISTASADDDVEGNISDTGESSESSDINNEIDPSDMFTDRDSEVGYDESESVKILLNGSTASCDSDAVQITGSTVTIAGEGTYILSGELEDGMLIVDADSTDKLQIVLDGVDIHSESSAAIYVLQADKVFLTLAEGSENTLSSGEEFIAIDDNNIDAVIFSKDDITLNGMGSLNIVSQAGHGIVSKDDLVITSGTYSITSASHGLSGKDSVRIAGGCFTILAGKDGIHAENTDDATQGFLYIAGGTYDITAEGDGLSAENALQIDDGSFTISSGGGSANANGAVASSEDTTSSKGIKAAGNLVLNGGTFFIDSADDAFHSNASLTVNAGTYEISTGDDGFHADERLMITDGSILITESYEGIEGLRVDISGGEITLTASDDGINAAGGKDQSGSGGFHGYDSFGSNSDAAINISGGVLNVNAFGDGIDSNGSLTVSGGQIYVSGSTDGGNSALDCDSDAVITGGTVVAAGSSQMAQGFGSSSTQGVIMLSCGTQAADSIIELADKEGQVILFWQADKQFDFVIVSSPEIVQDSTYILSAGNYSTEILMETLVYGSGNGMEGRPDMGGKPEMEGRPDMGGKPDMEGRPDMGEKPDMEDIPERK